MELGGTEREVLEKLLAMVSEKNRREAMRLFYKMYPYRTTEHADGSVFHARNLYQKHMEFFEAGANYRERCFMAGNRIGKTMGAGGYEVACHLTGEYPSWWKGRRFEKAVRVWVAGKTNETTRDIVQTTLLGSIQSKALHNAGNKGFTGEGLIPGELLGKVSWKQGVTDLADLVKVQHKSGKWSSLGIKSYQQGRGSFEGTAQHVIWLDEEPPLDVYGECLTRTMTVGGIVLMTFTPLEGMSETVLQFLPGHERPEELAAGA